jgi:hypothetical protein
LAWRTRCPTRYGVGGWAGGAAGRVAVVTSPDGAAKANGELEHKLAVTTVL